MRLVILESPYAGDVEVNVTYARAALADSLRRGEAPIASHLLYTQPGVLRDDVPGERQLGIAAGLAWGRVADLTAVYVDRGMTPGMQQGIERAGEEGRAVEVRRLRVFSVAGHCESIDGELWHAPGTCCEPRCLRHPCCGPTP